MPDSDVALQKIRAQFDQYLCPIHPGLFLRHVRCVDNTTGDEFRFHFSPEQLARWASTPNDVVETVLPEDVAEEILLEEYDPTGWEWQGDLIDWWVNSNVTMILKARQLGITWCAAGVALWYLLYRPGTRVLVQSKNEDDASDLVDHIWEMWLSLDNRQDGDYSHLRQGIKVLRPAKSGSRPHLDIEFLHRDGRKSELNAMASTAGAGHGRTAGFVILDEFSRHPYAREAYKAVIPAQGGSVRKHGKTAIISTANGISVGYDAGNFYHHLWSHSAEYGIRTKFLPWSQNPDRDEEWYQEVPLKMPPADRGEQYPSNEREAFILTGDRFFDEEALLWYEDHVLEPLYRGTFEIDPESAKRARFRRSEFGWVSVYREPTPKGRYALASDAATGRGKDYSAGYVIDLDTGQLCAEIHCKMDAVAYAAQLHFLGLWFNTALITIELGGGYGDAVIHPLRDGVAGRPPYPRLYRHRDQTNVKLPGAKRFGFPMTLRTRPQIIAQTEAAMRQRMLEDLPSELLGEMNTFVHRATGTSPAAQDGCNDDRVMAFCLALEMHRRYGAHDTWREAQPDKVEEKLLRRRDGTLDPKVLAARYPAH